jgi:hypothetical protein
LLGLTSEDTATWANHATAKEWWMSLIYSKPGDYLYYDGIITLQIGDHALCLAFSFSCVTF